MGKLITFLLLLSATVANADVHTAASASYADVKAAYDLASDGDIVQIPAGTATWDTVLEVSKAIHLRGAGVGQTIIRDNVDTANSTISPINARGGVIVFQTTAGKRYELSGIEFNDNTPESPPYTTTKRFAGAIQFRGASEQCVVHNIKYDNSASDSRHAKWLYTYDQTLGVVYDSEFIHNDTQAFVFDLGDYGGVYDDGNGSWIAADQAGTDQMWYVEDCTITNTEDGTTHSICDGFNGARFAFRYNDVANGKFNNHGTESGARIRGTRWVEIYSNTITHPLTDDFQGFFNNRSGSGVIHNNTLPNGKYAYLATMSTYRYQSAYDPWGGADGTNILDQNSTADTGTGSDNTAAGDGIFTQGTATAGSGARLLEDTSKSWVADEFIGHSVRVIEDSGTTTAGSGEGVIEDTSKSWTDDEWIGFMMKDLSTGRVRVIDDNTATTLITSGTTPLPTYASGVSYEIAQFGVIEDNDATTLTIKNEVAPALVPTFGTGDSYKVHKVDRPIDMSGTGQGTQAYTGGNLFSPVAAANNALSPVYEWNNTGTFGIGTWQADPGHIEDTHFSSATKPGYAPYAYPHPLRTDTSQVSQSYAAGDLSNLDAAITAWTAANPGSPFVVCIGDSIMAGFPNWTSEIEPGGPTGTATSDVAQVIESLCPVTIDARNMGYSGALMSFINSVASNNALPTDPKYLVVEGGINNLAAASDFATEETHFDAIKTACDTNGTTMVVMEVFPSTLASEANINAWNASLATWASTNSVRLIKANDYMGDPADMANLLDAQTTDDTHLTAAGVSRNAEMILATLAELEGDLGIWSSQDVELVGVEAAIAAAGASSKINIPAGIATWTSMLTIPKGVQLHGVGVATVTGTNGETFTWTTSPTEIQSGVTGKLIDGYTGSGEKMRLSGVRISDGGHNVEFGVYLMHFEGWGDMTDSLQIDNVEFAGNYYQAPLFLESIFGVMHTSKINTYTGVQPSIQFKGSKLYGSNTNLFGDGVYANDLDFGTDKFFYVEDCVMENRTWPNVIHLTENQASGRYVVRNSYMHNLNFGGHGTEAERIRGSAVMEMYDNHLNVDVFNNLALYQRGGVGVLHGNTYTGWQAGIYYDLLDNRSQDNLPIPFGGSDGRNPWDINDAGNPFDTGTMTAGSGLLTVEDTSKSWSDDQWIGYKVRITGGAQAVTDASITASVMTVNTTGAHGYVTGDAITLAGADEYGYNYSGRITVVDADTFTYDQLFTLYPAATTGTLYCMKGTHFGEIVDNDATTLTVKDSLYVFEIPGLRFTGVTGYTYEINRVTQALDQNGVWGGTDLAGAAYPTIPVGWNDQTVEPWYEWNNTSDAGEPDFEPTSPNIVVGTHAINDTQRPGYTAYTYPHPLRTGETPPATTPTRTPSAARRAGTAE